MHKTGFLRNFGNFKIPVLLFLILSVLQIFLIAESEGRMLANNHVKPQPVRKSSSAPGLLFGDPDRLEGTPGQRSLYEEIQADEEYVRDLILKRIKRSAANDKADREYEEDNEEEEELEAEEAERKEESAVAKEEEALKLKKDAEKLKKEAEKNKNATTSTKPPTLTQASSTTAPSTTPIAANSNSLLTKAPSTTPLPANSNAPLAAPQTGTTTMKPTVSNATNAGQRSNTTLPQGQRPSGPPRGPPPNGTIAYRTITLANGTKIQQQVRLPPGTVLGKPPPGSRPGPPGGKPPFPIPPHLLMMNNNAPAKPKANKGELYLPEDYNRLEIPKLDAGKIFGIKVDKLSPVPVLVFLNIRSIRDIDETNGEIVMDLDMKLEWVDGVLFNPVDALRGKHSKPITLNPVFLKKIWQPDIYIDELVRVRKVSLMAKPETVLFSPGTGLVSDTFRVIVRLSCEMDFYYYPADTHRCRFHLKSYSYFNADLNLSWLRNGAFLQDPGDPNFDLQIDSIEEVQIGQVFHEKNNDTYDGLAFTLLARRKLSFHMVQTYLPSVFFIIITWLCFLVPARMVEARIGISMTTLLTLTAMFSSVRESTPIVSYVKAIDIWMVFCIFFVFLTLLEFSLLVWIRSFREEALEKKNDLDRQNQEKRGHRNKGSRERSPSPSGSVRSEDLKRYELLAEFTEKWAFLIFSLVFLFFNIFYWSWLLTCSDYTNWSVNQTHNALLDD